MQERRTLVGNSSNYPEGAITRGSLAPAMSVLFVNNADPTIKACFEQAYWPDSDWTPIGIVVVPGSHDRYGDLSCGVMSLRAINLSDPVNGRLTSDATASLSSNAYAIRDKMIYYGPLDSAVHSSLSIPYSNSLNGSIVISSWGTRVMFPYVGTLGSTADSNSYHVTITDDPNPDIPSDMINYANNPAILDFNGIRNTVGMYMIAKLNNHNWTENTINESLQYEFAAFLACARFKTLGTESLVERYASVTSNLAGYGTISSLIDNDEIWYLPALGEICYLAPKFYEASNIISALNTKYGTVGVLSQSIQVLAGSTFSPSNGISYIYNRLNGSLMLGTTTSEYGSSLYIKAFTRWLGEDIPPTTTLEGNDVCLHTGVFDTGITKLPEASTFSIPIICNNRYLALDSVITVTTSNDWITSILLNPNQYDEILISISANTTQQNRTGSVSVSCTDRGNTYLGTINITQLGGIITLSSYSATVDASSGSINTNILLNGSPLIGASAVTTSNTGDCISSSAYLSDGKIKISYSANTDLNNSRTGSVDITYVGQTVTFTLTLELDEILGNDYAITAFYSDNVTCTYEKSNYDEPKAMGTRERMSGGWSTSSYVNGHRWRYLDEVYLGRVNVRNITGLKADIQEVQERRSGLYTFGNTISNVDIGVLDVLDRDVSIGQYALLYNMSNGNYGWNIYDGLSWVPTGIKWSYRYNNAPIETIYHYDYNTSASGSNWNYNLPKIGVPYDDTPVEFGLTKTYNLTVYPGLTASMTLELTRDTQGDSDTYLRYSRTGLTFS